MSARVTLLAALGLDQLFGEPPAVLHPVVWIGRLIDVFERLAPKKDAVRQFAYGAAMLVGTVGAAVGGATLAGRLVGRWTGGLAASLLGGALLKPSFALRELLAAGDRVQRRLEARDLQGARAALRSLVSREVGSLDEPLVAAAAIESLAENLSDSFVAPLLAYTLAGLPGAWAVRAVNTLDSRVGYHGRYEHLGKAAARADDAVNLLPARLSGRLIAVAASGLGEDGRGAWVTMQRDARLTESPNAGWPMSAMAGALDVRLEKPGHYRLNAEGAAPGASDIGRARRLVRAAAGLGSILFLVLAGGLHARRAAP
jgi:adenosylcobinamide-phosphate synthase